MLWKIYEKKLKGYAESTDNYPQEVQGLEIISRECARKCVNNWKNNIYFK